MRRRSGIASKPMRRRRLGRSTRKTDLRGIRQKPGARSPKGGGLPPAGHLRLGLAEQGASCSD
eukprot:9055233-Alexandrium_andersonii.AAC.1